MIPQRQEELQSFQPKHTTNQIITYQNNQNIYVYLPAFTTLKIIGFRTINVTQLSSQVMGMLRLYIYFGQLPTHIIDFIVQNLRIHFTMDQSIILDDEDQDGIRIKKKAKLFNKKKQVRSFYINTSFIGRIHPNIFFTPFEFLDIVLTIELPDEITHNVDNTKYIFKFNFMSPDQPNSDNKKLSQCLLFSDTGSINYYDLAEKNLAVEYTDKESPAHIFFVKGKKHGNKFFDCIKKPLKRFVTDDESRQEDDESKQEDQIIDTNIPKSFKYAHFHMPVYKFPFVSLATIFFPLWLLGIINIAVYHAQNQLSSRIQVLSFVALGYVEVMSINRQQIPTVMIVTFLQIGIYLNLVSVLFVLIESLIIRLEDENRLIIPFYVLSAIILISTIVFPIIIYLFYRCYLLNAYNLEQAPLFKKMAYQDFNLQYNTEANQYFQKLKKQYPDKLHYEDEGKQSCSDMMKLFMESEASYWEIKDD